MPRLYLNLLGAIVSSEAALENFIQTYISRYREQLSENPRYYPQGEDSPCILNADNMDLFSAVQWQMIKRKTNANFNNVEQALNIKFWPEINDFYGAFFAAPLLFEADFGVGELTQVWNNKDFEYLQKNIIGHLMMKNELKQPLTWFIGLFNEGEIMLTVNNQDGSVWTEIPGEVQGEKLADDISAFMDLLTPRVAPAIKYEELPMPEISHPGILKRMKLMWQNLSSKG